MDLVGRLGVALILGAFAACGIDPPVEPTDGADGLPDAGETLCETRGNAPTVAFVSPLSDATVAGTVVVRVDTGGDCPVVRVELYVGDTLLLTRAAPPYETRWDTSELVDGHYELKAIVTDNKERKVEAVRSVFAEQPCNGASKPCPQQAPTVAIACPKPDLGGKATCVGRKLELCADAHDDGYVKEVRYAVDRNLLPGVPEPPRWEASWDTSAYEEGRHEVKAVAKDDDGLSTEAVLQVVVDRTPPSVALASPVNDAHTPGFPVEVSLQADDGDGCGIASVTYVISSPASTTETWVIENAPYDSTWTPRTDTPSGTYTFTATAVDRAGNDTTTAARTVLLDRPPMIWMGALTGGTSVGGVTQVFFSTYDDLSTPLVDLIVDGVKVARALPDSNYFSWDTRGLARGEHEVRVVATDSLGQTEEDARVVFVDQPLTVRCQIRVCVDGDPDCVCDEDGCFDHPSRDAHGTVTLAAIVVDDEPIDSVDFFVDGVLVGTTSTPPFQHAWETGSVEEGVRAVTCRAQNDRFITALHAFPDGLNVNNCDADHDGLLSNDCGGSDCNDTNASLGSCAGALSTCDAGACVCAGRGAFDTCIAVGTGFCNEGTCAECSSGEQCGDGFTCVSGQCEQVCTDGSCGTGQWCSTEHPKVCLGCLLTSALRCGTSSAPDGCFQCSGSTPVCSEGGCVCESDEACGVGRFCGESGACESCRDADALYCGTGSSAAGCEVCSGVTSVCVAGSCVCGGSRETDTCVAADLGVCVNGACAACSSHSQCPAGFSCASGNCVDREGPLWPIGPDTRHTTVSTLDTVTDNVTGLVWQRRFSSPYYYTWPNAVTFCKDLTLEGHSDWRLPTLVELGSILAFEYFNPAVNNVTYPSTANESYWSSTASLVEQNHRWVIGFGSGGVGFYGENAASFRVRCVRGGNVPTVQARYTTTEATVVDNVTGRTWQRVAPETNTYTQATGAAYCSTLTLDGRSDWRLPTVKELLSLNDVRAIWPAIDGAAFPNTSISNAYWSSSALASDNALGWAVTFGYVRAIYQSLDDKCPVRCVR